MTNLENSSTDEIMVSVIVITYNHAKYIGQALDSILLQETSFRYEIILGEDESTDGTREICLEYAERFKDRIRLFLRSRSDVIYIDGLPSGRYNFLRSLEEAKGKYIALCEGDDFWCDITKLQKQVDRLEGNVNFSGSFHETQIVTNDVALNIVGQETPVLLSISDTLSVRPWFHTSSFVFRKFDKALPEWFKEIRSSDLALFTLVAHRGSLIKIPGIMSSHRKHDASLTAQEQVISARNYNRIKMYRLLDEYLEFKYHDVILNTIRFHERMIEKRKPRHWLFKWLKS